jgi:hypothetical protein
MQAPCTIKEAAGRCAKDAQGAHDQRVSKVYEGILHRHISARHMPGRLLQTRHGRKTERLACCQHGIGNLRHLLFRHRRLIASDTGHKQDLVGAQCKEAMGLKMNGAHAKSSHLPPPSGELICAVL